MRVHLTDPAKWVVREDALGNVEIVIFDQDYRWDAMEAGLNRFPDLPVLDVVDNGEFETVTLGWDPEGCGL